MLCISELGNKYPRTGAHRNWNWVTTFTKILPVCVHRKICSSGYKRNPVKRKHVHWIIHRCSIRLWNLRECFNSLNHSDNLRTLSMDMEGSSMMGCLSWIGQINRSVWDSNQFMYIKHPVLLTNCHIFFFTFNLCSLYTVAIYVIHLRHCVLFQREFLFSYWKYIKSEGCRYILFIIPINVHTLTCMSEYGIL
jgi:hypothetical protein